MNTLDKSNKAWNRLITYAKENNIKVSILDKKTMKLFKDAHKEYLTKKAHYNNLNNDILSKRGKVLYKKK